MAATFVMVAGYVVASAPSSRGSGTGGRGFLATARAGRSGKRSTRRSGGRSTGTRPSWSTAIVTFLNLVSACPDFDEGQTQRSGSRCHWSVCRAPDLRRRLRGHARVRVRLQRRERRGGLEGVRGGPRPAATRRLRLVAWNRPWLRIARSGTARRRPSCRRLHRTWCSRRSRTSGTTWTGRASGPAARPSSSCRSMRPTVRRPSGQRSARPVPPTTARSTTGPW